MNLRALKIGNLPDGRLRPAELTQLNGDLLESRRRKEAPVAYLVSEEHIDPLLRLDRVIDRGEKHDGNGLSRSLLGQKRIPLIRADYTTPARMRRGIHTLLANAAEQGERNLYLIVTTPEMFADLCPPGSADGDVADDEPDLSEGVLNGISQEEVPEELRYELYLGEAPEVRAVHQLILKAAPHDFPVLIIGPTGTGKEIVARAIHEYGPRRHRPFKAINCSTIPSALFESELFGHEKGAFTGAHRETRGLWEAAGSGTLFLDEIGDMPLDLQAKILRTLQENTIRRIGSTEDIEVHARVLLATNRDLYDMVRKGHFREDLYYRLRDFLIPTPALRDHLEDLPLLARFLWRSVTRKPDAQLFPEVIDRLAAYRWPGNVRELKAVLTSLYALAGEHPEPQQLELVFRIQGQSIAATEEDATEIHRAECLRHLERAAELIQACQVTLQPIVNGNPHTPRDFTRAHRNLHNRLHELSVLCTRPLLFHNEVTFSLVHTLMGKLEYLHGLLSNDGTDVPRHWTQEVAPSLDMARSSIFREVTDIVARPE